MWRWASLLAAIVASAAFTAFQQARAEADAGHFAILCSATASAPIVRIEGTRELLGDVFLTCVNTQSSAVPPGSVLEVDLTLALNVAIANQTSPGRGGEVSDAVLVVNENHCVGPVQSGEPGSCETLNPALPSPMLGRLSSRARRTLRWERIQLPVPGAPIGRGHDVADCQGPAAHPDSCRPSASTLRLTNLRADASRLGASGGLSGVAVPIEATLTLRSPTASVSLIDSSLPVAEAAPGLTAEAVAFGSDRICSHGEAVAEVMIAEGFAAAFKIEGQPSLHPGDPGWAEAYYPFGDAVSGPESGLGGTRVHLVLSGIPEGVSVFAPSRIACDRSGGGALELGLVSDPSPGGTGGRATPPQSGERLLLPTSESDVVAVYEVSRADPLVREACRIPLRFSRVTRDADQFTGGSVELFARLAPYRSAAMESGPSHGIRFVNARFNPRPRFQFASCGTTLFFPFVTNRDNFDTAIVIANTSSDPLGTRHQSAQCSLKYFDSDTGTEPGPISQQSGEIPAGGQLAFTISGGSTAHGLAPLTDIQGYLVVECGFQFATGFAFVTEQINGTAVLAQGYLAQTAGSVEDSGAEATSP